MSEDDRPQYGYGKFERPLWSERDRDGEEMRKVLRRAGFRDVGEHNGRVTLHGFAVEGGHDGEPFSVTLCDERPESAEHLDRYAEALTAAGWTAQPDPEISRVLEVRRDSAAPTAPPATLAPDATTWFVAVAILIGVAVLTVLAFTTDIPVRGRMGVLAVAALGVLAAVTSLRTLRATR